VGTTLSPRVDWVTVLRLSGSVIPFRRSFVDQAWVHHDFAPSWWSRPLGNKDWLHVGRAVHYLCRCCIRAMLKHQRYSSLQPTIKIRDLRYECLYEMHDPLQRSGGTFDQPMMVRMSKMRSPRFLTVFAQNMRCPFLPRDCGQKIPIDIGTYCPQPFIVRNDVNVLRE